MGDADTGRKLRLLLHTVDGCVPYMTPSTLEKHFPASDENLWLGLAVRDTSLAPLIIENTKNPKKKQKVETSESSTNANKKPSGYTFLPTKPDSWLHPYKKIAVPTFDPIADNKKGTYTCTNKSVLVWTPHGRQKLTPEAYNNASLALDAEYTLSLYDVNYDVDGKTVNSKRQQKAEQRNKEWFGDLVKTCSNSAEYKDRKLWAPVLIPDLAANPSAPVPIARLDDQHSVSGIALIGKWHNQLETILQDSEYENVVMLSTGSLREIVEIASGSAVNMIGTDLPQQWAKKKLAFVLNFSYNPGTSRKQLAEIDTLMAAISAKHKTATESKKASIVGDLRNLVRKIEKIEEEKVQFNSDGCIDMSDKKLERQAEPLVKGCACMACSNSTFSRAYIHHLVVAKEILAEILLFAHNLYQMMEILKAFRETTDPVGQKMAFLNQLKNKKAVQ